MLNAAVWFGSLVFFTVLVGPTFFSREMTALLGRPAAGAAAQIMIERYFILQQWCAGIALGHFILDWIYTGRTFRRATLGLLAALFAVAVVGGHALVPKMRELHLEFNSAQTPPAQRETARRSFGILHGASQTFNLCVMGGVLFYLWQTSSQNGANRYGGVGKFRT